MERILVLNLGSTSSKIAAYVMMLRGFAKQSDIHRRRMAQFDDVLEQFNFRNERLERLWRATVSR